MENVNGKCKFVIRGVRLLECPLIREFTVYSLLVSCNKIFYLFIYVYDYNIDIKIHFIFFFFSSSVDVFTVKSLLDITHFSKKHRYKPYMIEVSGYAYKKMRITTRYPWKRGSLFLRIMLYETSVFSFT